jgi:hypothetical protein
MSTFDLDRHLRSGGTVTISYHQGTPDVIIDARFDAHVPGDAPRYEATARNASGDEVAWGMAHFSECPERALEDLREVANTEELPELPDDGCPF